MLYNVCAVCVCVCVCMYVRILRVHVSASGIVIHCIR